MTQPPCAWSALLADAVTKPGVISSAYRRFWTHSIGNQHLALFQCTLRGLEPGPLNTFLGWQRCRRHVRKGEKALTLCMPLTIRKRDDRAGADDVAESKPESQDECFTRFVYRPYWFVLCQTEGEEYGAADLPEWSEKHALISLSIRRIPFWHTDGNTQGYACRREVAVSPIAFAPHRTLFHELAHVVLGHTAEAEMIDKREPTPRDLREVEAESVALICCDSLGLGGGEYCRGYIQHWLAGQTISDRSAQRIFRAADMILRAGRPEMAASEPRVQA